MNKRLAGTILAILLILIGGLRLTFALSAGSLTFDGYQHARFVEEILETGIPLREDPLSFGGREHAYSPLYYYLVAPFALVMGVELALKTIPNIWYLAAIALVYLIAHEISKNRTASILATVLAALTPITFSQYINDGSPYTLAIPLFLGLVYALLRPQKRLPLLVVLGIILGLVSPIALLLLAGIIIFLLLLSLEGLQAEDSYLEILFFLLFFSLWSVMVFFKEVFFTQGIASIWAYIPSSILSTYYSEFTLVTAIATIGALPLIFAAHASYHSLFIRRQKRAILVLGMILAITAALVVQVVPLESGVVLLTFLLSILSAHSIAIILRYFEKTKAPKLQYLALSVVLFFFLFASLFPALSLAQSTTEDIPSQDHYSVAEFLHDETVLAAPKEGFFFQYHGVATMTDTDFLLVEDAEQRYIMTEEVYRARFVLPVLEAAERYGFEYIVFSDIARQDYAREQLLFLGDCFRPAYGTEHIEVFEVVCDVKKS